MNTALHPMLRYVTRRVVERSHDTRSAYKTRVAAAGRKRDALGCANIAHALAACSATDKDRLATGKAQSIGIVTAYNDMLSAHQPLERFPSIIRTAAGDLGAVAQVAGGVPAMCDGITQGELGMELSLFSRDLIAMSTAVALSHNTFDAALCLGVCDKIVPGLFIGAASFGHLPVIFVPAGPMPSGLSNKEKAELRQQAAEGKLGRAELLAAEMRAYHAPGTCTFYGTANSNQLLMEIMGLHLPGASFVPPNTPLRDALSREAVKYTVEAARSDAPARKFGLMLDERSVVNAVVGLLATGGSTNHTLHLVAMAAAIGVQLTWQDFSDLASVVPLLTRIYPNGSEDINAFQNAGGMPFLIGELLKGGYLHNDVETCIGTGLQHYLAIPELEDGEVVWREGPAVSKNLDVLRPVYSPFAGDSGLRVMSGNLGKAVVKVSAVQSRHYRVEAEARVFDDQETFQAAFKAGELNRDVVVVIRQQGPMANGMPELHKLMPPLGVLQDKGFKVALVTDGRLSGASGKVPAAIHLTPEASQGGPLALVQDGDPILVDCATGLLKLCVSGDELAARRPAQRESSEQFGMGRELFAAFRSGVSAADHGATVFNFGGSISRQ